MKTILFVDDEPNILEGLERMLFPMRKQWQMAFAPSGQQALALMAQKPFDVIVTDMRMPGMDGSELLKEVTSRYPETVRFVLSGQSDKETVFRSVGAAHQFLAKPCDARTLKRCVDRAFALRDILHSAALKALVAQVSALPTLPRTYTKLMAELQSADASIASAGRIIESDVAMTAKILQLANSAFFGMRQHVSSATHAASLLGLDTIKGLVLMAGVFPQANGTRVPPGFSLDRLWWHSLAVGALSQAITKAEGRNERIGTEALTSGLLHDCGALVLAVGHREKYQQALTAATASRMPVWKAEQEVLGCTHAEVGAYLLGIWGLPDPIVEAVAFHHNPSACPEGGFSPLTAVHCAEGFDHEMDETQEGPSPPSVDEAYLAALGLGDRLAPWRELCRSIGKREEDAP